MGMIHEKNQRPKISCYCTFNFPECKLHLIAHLTRGLSLSLYFTEITRSAQTLVKSLYQSLYIQGDCSRFQQVTECASDSWRHYLTELVFTYLNGCVKWSWQAGHLFHSGLTQTKYRYPFLDVKVQDRHRTASCVFLIFAFFTLSGLQLDWWQVTIFSTHCFFCGQTVTMNSSVPGEIYSFVYCTVHTHSS